MSETWGNRSVHVARWSWKVDISWGIKIEGRSVRSARSVGIERLLLGESWWIEGGLAPRRIRS